MSFYSSPSSIQYIIVIILSIALLFSIVTMALSITYKIKPIYLILSILLLLLNSVMVLCLMKGAYLKKINEELYPELMWFVSLPLWLVIFLTFLIIYLNCLAFISIRVWKSHHLTPMSIKESLDELSTAICIYDKSGQVNLVNSLMDELALLIMDKAILNGHAFWDDLNNKKSPITLPNNGFEKGPIVKLDDGRVYSFHKYEHSQGKKVFYEIIGTNITRRYLLGKDLEEKNKDIKEMNNRFRDYGDNILNYTKENEILAAKRHIHDNMGKLLLLSKMKLSESMSKEDKEKLISEWDVAIAGFGLGSNKEDTLKELMDAANSIGVKIIIDGNKINNPRIRKILIAASIETMTNLVSHAKGDELYISLKEEGPYFVAIFTNNGKRPEKEIIEGGGLSSLRALVEKEYGIMEIESKPRFLLKISLPYKNK